MKTQKTPATIHKNMEWIFQFWAWQLLIWVLYRYFFHLPEWVDEFIFKPLVFVMPVLWYVIRRERASLATVGLTAKNGIKNLAIGLGIGVVFLFEGVLINFTKNGIIQIQQLSSVASYSFVFLSLLSLATAFSEELLSRGFLFSRLYAQTKQLWYSVILSTGMFIAFHIPVLATSLKFQGPTLLLFFFTTILISVINSILFFQTKSLITPLLVHFFWNMTVALFF